MQWISYFFARAIAAGFWLIPFPALYKISNGLAFLLYKVIGYRAGVVEENLRRCFPEKSAAEIKNLAYKSYLNLSDITLETIKSLSTPVSEIVRRYKVCNPEILEKYFDEGRTVIICGTHYNNWEWGVLTINLAFRAQTFGINSPLTNKLVDNFINKKRVRGGMELVPKPTTFEHIEANLHRPGAYLILGDQSPSNRKRIHWVNFLGVETACASGADFISKKYNFPVFYLEIQRVKRGYYELHFSEMFMEPRQAGEGEVTQKLMENLEKAVRRQPENWLWSHRRWKIQREDLVAV